MNHVLPVLILLAPLVASLAAAFSGERITPAAYRTGTVAHVVALIAAALVLREVAPSGAPPIRVTLMSSSWNFLTLGLSIDRLAAVMMVMIAGIGAIIHLYSIRFMQQERGVSRFHSLLSLTISVLLFMVSSASLVMLFLFWQLLSWLLSLLAYNYVHRPTAQGAFRTFIMLRAGDMFFLSGIVLAHHLYGSVGFQQIFDRAASNHAVFSPFGPESVFSIHGNTLVTFLIFIGAMSKSAQFPLHMWLPDSLYAPTPVHALLHAGIINAGGFLLNRLAPLYALSHSTLHLVFAVGLLTALLGASMMLTQNDIKKTLGYSTIGQMGYMIMECGLGAFALAVFHLIAHGLFKATIFLNCGNVIHSARHDPRIPKKSETAWRTEFSLLTWLTGFVTTLTLPLVILLALHGVLQIPLANSKGAIIFLFFSWITSSQAILTLYRLKAVDSWKGAAIMFLTLILILATYLFAVDRFTLFLYPKPGQAAGFFQAAALPGPLFNSLIAGASLFLILHWISIYTRSHGRPAWVSVRTSETIRQRLGSIRIRLYLLLMNRLYLDVLMLRASRQLRGIAERLDRSRLFLPICAIATLILAVPPRLLASRPTFGSLDLLLSIAMVLTLPLFPFHGLYVAALTRVPGSLPSVPGVLAILMPGAGLFAAAVALPSLPPAFHAGIRTLALAGAFYGTIKAIVQIRVTLLLAYASLSLYSILWWHLAEMERVTLPETIFAGTAAWVTGGLLLVWVRVKIRFGDLPLERIGGLARPMPRLFFLMALLVMAGAGLPPFGLFPGYLGMLLESGAATGNQASLSPLILLPVWFGASWYLFRLMQRLCFGPQPTGIPCDDLRPSEMAPLVVVLIILIAFGLLPYGCSDSWILFGGPCATIGAAWNR
ncbi:MAG: proton-conducting transporter transmembrane domain-containing protein [Leptospirales bacterium]